MKESIKNIIFIIYIIIAIFTTICLLSFNKFRVTEFGDTSLVIVSNNQLEPTYNKGDIVIVNKNDEIVDGENVFFYTIENREIKIKLAKVERTQRVTKDEKTYTLEGNGEISSEYVIGSAKTASIIPKVGVVLEILESKWGFLFIIVLPALIAFLNQIAVVYSDIVEAKKEGKKKVEKE